MFTSGDATGPVSRGVVGNRFATVAIDPALGYLFGTGASFGYGASLFQNTTGSIDVQFANFYPPTGVTATATTGGSLAAGTYYATVTATSDTCSHQSAISVQSTGRGFGSNNAVSVWWTAPVAGMTPVAGYCVNVSTSPNMNRRITGNRTIWIDVCVRRLDDERDDDDDADGLRMPSPPRWRRRTGSRRAGWASIN